MQQAVIKINVLLHRLIRRLLCRPKIIDTIAIDLSSILRSLKCPYRRNGRLLSIEVFI